MERICCECKVSKPLELYEGNRAKCKNCKNKETVKRRNSKEVTHVSVTQKSCQTCKTMKSIDEFHKSRRSPDMHHHECKLCRRTSTAERKARVNLQDSESQESKLCSRCNIIKPLAMYAVNKKAKDGFQLYCKSCARPNTWTYDKQLAASRKYEANNKEKRAKRLLEPTVRMKKNIARRISLALQAAKSSKNQRTNQYLGCSIAFFKAWMEFQFVEGMTWQNMGQWHIDHVKPCKSFNLSNIDEQMACFNWRNLRPLWGVENMKKSGKLDK